jgi:hypothetical protein
MASHPQTLGAAEETQAAVLDPIVMLDRVKLIFDSYAAVSSDTIIALPPRHELSEQLKNIRLSLLNQLLAADTATIRRVLSHAVMREGMFQPLLYASMGEVEANIVNQVRTAFAQGWRDPFALNLYTIILMYYQASDLPLNTDGLKELEPSVLKNYFIFCARNAVCVQTDDYAKYAKHMIRFMDWCSEQIGGPHYEDWLLKNLPGTWSIKIIASWEGNALALAEARSRFVKALNHLIQIKSERTIPPFNSRKYHIGRQKIRIGYLIHELGQTPEMQLLLSEIEGFDTDKIEVYLYPFEICGHLFQLDKAEFYRRLVNKISEIRSVHDCEVGEFVDLIRKDELDIFILHDRAYYGFQLYQLACAHRVAPLQIVASRLLSVSTAHDSFDYFLTPHLGDAQCNALRAQVTEKLKSPPGMLAVYDHLQSQASTLVTRTQLGIQDSDVVLLCASATDEITPVVCDAFARILAKASHAKLILMTLPHVLDWDTLLPELELRLGVALRGQDVDRERVIIINKLEYRNLPQLLELSDIYLCPWPTSELTWLMMAMDSAVPLVVKDSAYLQGTANPSLIRETGFEDLVAKDIEDYVGKTIELVVNKEKRDAIRKRLKMQDNPPYKNLKAFSLQMQDFYINLVKEAANP